MSQTTPRLSVRSALLASLAVAVFAALGLSLNATVASASGSLTIYQNSMRSPEGVAKIRKYGRKANCSHRGSTKSLRVKIGKATRECFYNIPVVGRDLQATITARLFAKTPKKVIKRTWVAVNLRQAADGSRYQFAVLPETRRYSLRKVSPDGKIIYLDHGKSGKAINPVGKANRITLRAFNGVSGQPAGSARLVGIVNGKRLSLVDDPHGNELAGRDTTISIGSNKGAKSAFGSFIGATVAMPDPY